MTVQFKGIVWVGVRTSKFDELCSFYETVAKLPTAHHEDGFRVFDLPNGDKIEVFSNTYPENKEFASGPVVGFLVSNIEEARKEMEASGIEFMGPIQGTNSKWSHFKGPDGNIYEITVRAHD